MTRRFCLGLLRRYSALLKHSDDGSERRSVEGIEVSIADRLLEDLRGRVVLVGLAGRCS